MASTGKHSTLSVRGSILDLQRHSNVPLRTRRLHLLEQRKGRPRIFVARRTREARIV